MVELNIQNLDIRQITDLQRSKKVLSSLFPHLMNISKKKSSQTKIIIEFKEVERQICTIPGGISFMQLIRPLLDNYKALHGFLNWKNQLQRRQHQVKIYRKLTFIRKDVTYSCELI